MTERLDIEKLICEECDSVKNLLLEKQKAYGDSAFDPLRIFSKAGSEEQILVRLDDKLSRIARGKETSIQEDTVQDLIGYLILLKVCRRLTLRAVGGEGQCQN